MANIKISQLAEQPNPSTSATLVGVDNGETVQIPINSILVDSSPAKGLKYYTVENLGSYMSAISNKIEEQGGTANDFNLVLCGGHFLWIRMAYTGDRYSVTAIDLGTLKSWSAMIYIDTTTISDFLAMASTSTYQQQIDEVRNNALPYITLVWDSPSTTKLSAIIDALEAAGKLGTYERVLVRLRGYSNALLLLTASKYNDGTCSIDATDLQNCEILRCRSIDPTTVTVYDFLDNYVVNNSAYITEEELSEKGFATTEYVDSKTADVIKNNGQTGEINISSPESIKIANPASNGIGEQNTIIVSPGSGITLNSQDNIDIVSNSIHISNSYDYDAGITIDYANMDLHRVGKLYAKDDDEGADTMPAGCVLTSGDGNKIRWSNDYVHGDTFYDELLNYAAKEHTHEEYLTGETVFDVDGVATEKYVDDEISATLGTILATLNRI